ncbi:MAG: DUF2589 domain-containing protein [Chitinophagia bacterium]|jgi:hypothetical protein|nr:DUF2589 domain-containing protein [Chitinophagia bacterium]
MEFEENFKGIPIADLISAPLLASCEAQARICKDIVSFVKSLIKEDGTPQTLDFILNRMVADNKGELQKVASKVKAPILGLVPIPGLLIDDVEIEFSMEVHSTSSSQTQHSEKQESSNKKHKKDNLNPQLQEWLNEETLQINGNLSSTNKTSRSTDNSAKYHIKLSAKQHQVPEGMARILDMMSHSIGSLADNTEKK